MSNNFSRDRVTKDPQETGTEEDGEEQTPGADERENAVDLIVEHRDKQDGTCTYSVRWFG